MSDGEAYFWGRFGESDVGVAEVDGFEIAGGDDADLGMGELGEAKSGGDGELCGGKFGKRGAGEGGNIWVIGKVGVELVCGDEARAVGGEAGFDFAEVKCLASGITDSEVRLGGGFEGGDRGDADDERSATEFEAEGGGNGDADACIGSGAEADGDLIEGLAEGKGAFENREENRARSAIGREALEEDGLAVG